MTPLSADRTLAVPQRPQISVIVPTRDRPHMLRDALESVRAQDFDAFECIVVDDGSQVFAETERVVRELGDARFRLIQSRVAPPSSSPPLPYARGLALNAGIEEAQADWLCFLDDDDMYAPYRLSRGLAAVHARPDVRLTVARNGRFTVSTPVWPEVGPLQLRKVRNPLAQMMPSSSTWMLSRALAYQVGLFRPYGVMQDWEFYSKLWTLTTVWSDQSVTVAIRRHNGVRSDYGVQARIEMRRSLQRSGALSPNWASRSFQLYRLSQLELLAGNRLGAVSTALLSLLPIPYPRYINQVIRTLRSSVRALAIK